MNKIMTDKKVSIYGALKLIEQLYLDDEIPDYIFRNILREYQEKINTNEFVTKKKRNN